MQELQRLVESPLRRVRANQRPGDLLKNRAFLHQLRVRNVRHTHVLRSLHRRSDSRGKQKGASAADLERPRSATSRQHWRPCQLARCIDPLLSPVATKSNGFPSSGYSEQRAFGPTTLSDLTMSQQQVAGSEQQYTPRCSLSVIASRYSLLAVCCLLTRRST